MASPGEVMKVLVKAWRHNERDSRYMVEANRDLVKRMSAQGATAREIAREIIDIEFPEGEPEELLGQTYAMPEYDWYVVNHEGFIESGWEFIEDAQDRLREIKREGGAGFKVLSLRTLKIHKVDPRDDANWLQAYV